MISIIMYLLSLAGICSFSWEILYIESSFLISLYLRYAGEEKGFILPFALGIPVFALAKAFLGLTLSGYFIFWAAMWCAVATVIPGGFTISYLAMLKLGWIDGGMGVIFNACVVLDFISFIVIMIKLIKYSMYEETKQVTN